ncbi:MAG: TlpA disulfide reductase family protein [Chitinophagaceae bacterium]
MKAFVHKAIYTLLFVFALLDLHGKTKSDCAKPTSHAVIFPEILFDSIVLINKTPTSVNFAYSNKYNDRVRVFLLPHSIQTIYTKEPIYLIQTNQYQTFYILYPKERIEVALDGLKNAVMHIANDSIRNNELALTRILNESTPFPFYKITQLRNKLINGSYKEVDSLYTQEYDYNLAFLDRYKQDRKITKNFDEAMRAYFSSHLYATQLLFIGTESKDNVSKTYYEYLDGLEDIIVKKPLYKDDFWFSQLQYVFLKYKYRQLTNISSKKYSEEMYQDVKHGLTGTSRDRILFYVLKDRGNMDNIPDKKLFDDFMTTEGDDDYKIYISGIYDEKKSANDRTSRTSVQLLDGYFDFDSLMYRYKGTIVYVDVWVSWCGPCRNEMPYAAILRKKYANKPIAFIYISTDKDKTAWTRASSEEKLEGKNSYLLMNNDKSRFMSQYKITTIPRYMLIGKDGKMISSDAPRPSDPGLEKLIEQNL